MTDINQTTDISSQYISYLQAKKHNPQQKLEKHRIVPRHAQGIYEPNNVVLCSFKEHTLAHFYRYLSLKQKGDLIVYRFVCNQTEQG